MRLLKRTLSCKAPDLEGATFHHSHVIFGAVCFVCERDLKSFPDTARLFEASQTSIHLCDDTNFHRSSLLDQANTSFCYAITLPSTAIHRVSLSDNLDTHLGNSCIPHNCPPRIVWRKSETVRFMRRS